MKKLIVLLVLCSWFTFACTNDGPDLVPHAGDYASYCTVNDSNELVVSVHNIGNEASPVTSVRVEFGGPPSTFVYRSVPVLAVGELIAVPGVSFPSGCFNPDCGFKIVVDPLDLVEEKNEENNAVVGNCIG